MKSIRKLLWVLWGLGWVIVPVLTSALHIQRAIPGVMFISLALLFIVTWHKGAGVRMALRALSGGGHERPAARPAAEVRARVGVDDGPRHQVRVHAADVRPEELIGQTERQIGRESGEVEERRARRL